MSALERQAGDTTHIATASSLYGRERVMWVRRHIDLDIIARANLTVSQDNRHDSGFANYVSVGVQILCRGHQAGHETIELDTGIAKACDLDESRRPKTQASTGRQREKINAARRNVFSEIPRRYRKAPAKQLLKKLGVDEMDLPQVRHCGIPPHTRPVLHRGAQMGISIHPHSRHKANGVARALAEAVDHATRDRDHHPDAVSALYRTFH